jgi:uncharacterized phage infection (PIP) family protein YhgE
VVADEVRNLALRSAEAAKNTSDLIEKTIKAVKNGNEITAATQAAFKANAEIEEKIGQLVDEIATSSQEQANGISQVNTAVAEMDQVTQSTAASAEESASAAEEMNAQAQQMRGFVEELAVLVGLGGSTSSVSAPERSVGVSQRKTALLPPSVKIGASRAMPPRMNALPPPAGNGGSPSRRTRKSAGLRPEEIIPFDLDEKDGLKEF